MHGIAQDLDTPSWWQDVRGALRGTTHDYTSGPIGRSIFLLAIPMVLEMIMESLFALPDVFFVAKLGASAVATVGLTESMMIVVYTIAMGSPLPVPPWSPVVSVNVTKMGRPALRYR